ncbi:MAG: NAD-dependent epimerase/dehydratase family protein [Bacteroidia bacterium]|nr:NAD-dependent epimerase/dehydratase family protein [Bacteroidia bacterium]
MVLLTGPTGLLGTHVALELLNSGKQIRGLIRSDEELREAEKIFSCYSNDYNKIIQSIQWVNGDVLDLYSLMEAMDEVSEVYHCAGKISFNSDDEKEVWNTNAEGTANMVNVALEKGIKKFCHVSSVAALGESDGIITEETWWKHTPYKSMYAISKYGAEREVWRGAEEGLKVIVVNPSVIIGPHSPSNSSYNLFEIANKGSLFYSKGVMGFVDARDVAGVMAKLMDSEIYNQRFIVSSENKTYKEVYSTIATHLNKPKPFIKAGKLITGIAWRIDRLKKLINGKQPSLTKETAHSAHQKCFYSNAKIKKTLNFDFIPVEESIRHAAELYKKKLY